MSVPLTILKIHPSITNLPRPVHKVSSLVFVVLKILLELVVDRPWIILKVKNNMFRRWRFENVTNRSNSLTSVLKKYYK